MDRESDNFLAEMLLKELGAGSRRRARPPRGAAVVRRVLAAAGIPLAGVRIVDGSGLSLLDRLTATALVAHPHRRLERPGAQRSRSGGAAGRRRAAARSSTGCDDPPARGVVRAKTGTTNDASALSGYVRDRFAFVVVQNGAPVAATAAREGAGPVRDGARARLSRRVARGAPASLSSGTPAFSAFATFEPGLLADERRRSSSSRRCRTTFAPSASSAARASSRDIDSSVPVITYWLPVSGPSTGRSSSPASKRSPSARSSSTSAQVVLVGEPLGDRLGAVGAEARRPRRAPPASRRSSASTLPKWRARFCAGTQPIAGDVQPEEHARERHACP